MGRVLCGKHAEGADVEVDDGVFCRGKHDGGRGGWRRERRVLVRVQNKRERSTWEPKHAMWRQSTAARAHRHAKRPIITVEEKRRPFVPLLFRFLYLSVETPSKLSTGPCRSGHLPIWHLAPGAAEWRAPQFFSSLFFFCFCRPLLLLGRIFAAPRLPLRERKMWLKRRGVGTSVWAAHLARGDTRKREKRTSVCWVRH